MTTLGAQYYRPPNPPRQDWRRDLQRMKDAGMNTVKFWACWSWINITDEEYDFADLDELFDLAGRIGLRIVVNTILENAPYWLESQMPEARYVDEQGCALHMGGAMNTPGGGWPGLCFDNEAVWESSSRFLETIVRRYDRHPALEVWDVWNEPHLEPASYYPERMYCYCDASLARFTAWLRAKYKTLGALNDAWARRYSDWSQVAPPRQFEAVPDLLDWREFWFENLSHWLERRAAVVRQAGSTKNVMTHVALSGFTGQLATHTLDEYTLPQHVDVFGTSSFPTWLMADDHVEHLFNLDTARDAAAGRPFWQAELQGGRGRRDGRSSTGQPDPAVITLWMWNALAAGATGIMFWQWRPELLGPESPGYGLCTPDGSITDRLRAVTRFAQVASLPVLAGRSPATAAVGIVLSRATALHAYATDRTMALYRDSVLGAYRLLTDHDVSVALLHEDQLVSAGVPTQVDTLYWPMPSLASAALAEAIASFVDAGGRLLSEAGPGEYDQRGFRRADGTPEIFERLFGVREVETTSAPEGARFRTGDYSVPAAWQIESLQVSSATVVGRFADGSPAVTENEFGDGRALRVASYPSLAYRREASREVGQAMLTLLLPSGVARNAIWDAVEPGLVTREAVAADGTNLIFAMNWTHQPHVLSFPRGAELIVGDTVRSTSSTLPRVHATTVPARSGALFAAP